MVTSHHSLDSSPQTFDQWLQQAKSGSAEAIGKLLTTCSNYLLLVANEELDSALKGKLGASDLVQESLLEAQRDFVQFHGTSENDVLAWLRRILLNNLHDVREHFLGTQKRDVFREVSLDAVASGSRAGGVAGRNSSLIGKVVRREKEEFLESAMTRLPARYRETLLLRHRDGYSFDDIGRQTGRSPEAARKIWARAVEHLKQSLRSYSSYDSR